MSRKRLFLGLLPDAEVRDQLVALSKSFPVMEGASPVSKHNLHSTLQFLGHLEDAERECLEQKMLQGFAKSFSLRFDIYGYFKSPRTLWLGCSSYPRELTILAKKLKSIAKKCGARPEERIYRPHITLFRKVSKAEFPDVPFIVTWRATEFHLLESVSRENVTRYNVLKTQSLLRD